MHFQNVQERHFPRKKGSHGTPISRKGLVKSFKSQKCVLQLIFEHVQQFLRQIIGNFGPQLIRRVPNVKKTQVNV